MATHISQEDDYYNEALRAFLTKVKSKTLTPEDENPKGLWAPMGVVDTSTSHGRNFCIRSSFGVIDSSLEGSIRELQLLERSMLLAIFSKNII
jgi:hypothetical protein